MSNVTTLMQAGIIAGNAVLSADDTTFINGLSDAEVNALISIHNNAPSGFWSRNCGSSSSTPISGQSIGIVF